VRLIKKSDPRNVDIIELGKDEYIHELEHLPRPYVVMRGEEILDRYETFSQVREDPMVKGQYCLYEQDPVRGTRRTFINSETGEVIAELEWKPGEEIVP